MRCNQMATGGRGTIERKMDRALPASDAAYAARRRGFYHNPIQPVPPSFRAPRPVPGLSPRAGAVRGPGPQTRTYSRPQTQNGRLCPHEKDDACPRDGSPFGDCVDESNHGGSHSRDDSMDVVRAAADPAMAQKIRFMYNTIRLIHHQNNLKEDGGSAKEMIRLKVSDLAKSIRPALPEDKIRHSLMRQAINWGHAVHLELQQHYTQKLLELQEHMKKDSNADWPKALEVAERWTKHNLPTVKNQTMNQARTLILDCYQEADSKTTGPVTEPETSPNREASLDLQTGPVINPVELTGPVTKPEEQTGPATKLETAPTKKSKKKTTNKK